MKKWTPKFIIGTFVTLYAVVSIISTIHVIDFFLLSNPTWLAVSLAIAFEIGAAASLASIIAMDKMNKGLIWFLFIVLTTMQMMGNAYYAYMHLENFQGWIELFGLVDEEPIFQKRVLSIISGAILPLVSLGFIKSLVDYIKPDKEDHADPKPSKGIDVSHVWDKVAELRNEGKFPPEPTAEELADEPTALANSGYRERAEMASDDMYSEDERKDVITHVTGQANEVPNSQSSVEINNINKELTEDDIKKYEEATKSSQDKSRFHPQVFR
jgi:hypothetical protein